MFASRQTYNVPNTPQDLLERHLEPDLAYAIDPPGTIEVDDAISVRFEESLDNKLTAHINTYIADTALIGFDPEIFNNAQERAFTNYRGRHTDYMIPKDILSELSLGNDNDNGAPAVAIRTRIHNHNIALVGIDKVRVKVRPCSYDEFEKLVVSEESTSAKDIVRASKMIKNLRNYDTETTNIDAHEVVANHMVMANIQLAKFALQNSLPWIYRSHKGNINPQRGRLSSQAHYTHRHRLHRALGNVVYCHGTSPLRRFPDFVDHLVLDAHLSGQEHPFSIADIREFSIEANVKMRQMLGSRAAIAA